jgi:hypothetical protein
MLVTIFALVYATVYFLTFGLVTASHPPVSREILTPVNPAWPPPSTPMVMTDEEAILFDELALAWTYYSEHWFQEFLVEPEWRYSYGNS